jgi:Ca2+-binding EF-hand superfamily protein
MEDEFWELFDKDKRGYVTFREIYEIFGEESKDETKITYEDLKVCLDNYIPEEECISAFNFFDTTNSGKITRNDIKKSMKKLGEELLEEELTEMLMEIGLEDKEFLTYVEFKELIK